MRGFAKFLAFVFLLIVIAGGVAWFWAGRQPGPAVQFRQPDKYVGQTSDLDLMVETPQGQLSRLDVTIEQNGKSFPIFALDQPAQATTRQDSADRFYVMRPIGKRSIPELQAGPARIVVHAARPVLRGMRQAETETTRDVQVTGQVVELDPDAMVWRRDAGLNPGGALYDDGVHKYATAVLWIGEIGDISAIVTRGADFLTETPAAAMWRFKGRQCLGIIDYTAAPEMMIRAKYYRADEFFEIHGSRGIIWVTRGTGEMLDMPPVVLVRGTETVSYQVPADWRLGFDGAAADFIDSLLAGRQPAQDIRIAKHILQVPLAIYEASRVNRPVSPDSIN